MIDRYERDDGSTNGEWRVFFVIRDKKLHVMCQAYISCITKRFLLFTSQNINDM